MGKHSCSSDVARIPEETLDTVICIYTYMVQCWVAPPPCGVGGGGGAGGGSTSSNDNSSTT